MSFNYNNEVLDLLLKKTLGSAYTSADLVSGQETPVLPKIQNSQIFTNRITDANASNFTWSSSSNVAGGGTVKYLDVVTGETSTFQYIKKYEAIPMTVVAGTNNRAWKPTDSGMQAKFENVILGKPNFNFSITTDITNYGTIYSTNSGYKPVINNGVLVFLGNSVPASTTVMAMKEVYIYEGAFGTTTGMLISDISNVNITSPQDGQALVYDNATQKWIAGTVGADYIPISTLETLDDVSLNNLNIGQTISYDGFKWVPTNVPQDLSDISDVDLTGATAGQAIVYDGSSNKWKPGNVQTPLIQLGDISDVKFDDGPYDGQGLVWKDVSSCWIAKDIQTPLNSLDDVSGIDLSGIVPGQTIVLDISGIFVPKTIGEVIENLSDLKDVDVSNLADQIPQWTQKNRLEASDAAVSDNFGFSSALDISYSLVGAPNANSSNAADVGKAYLYKKNFFLGTYSEDQILMPVYNDSNMNFGYSVAIGREWLVVGAPNHSYNENGQGFKEKVGSVYFYKYDEVTEKWGTVNGSVYNQNTAVLPGGWTGLGKQNANAQYGYSVDMDASSNWCIIGIPQTNAGFEGMAQIWENVSGTWTYRKQITSSDGATGDSFGYSVTINDGGTFAFVGANNHNSAKGAVYVFKKNHPNAGDWGQYQKIVSLDERINSYFGNSVSVHGNTLLIGSPNGGNFSGAVYEVTYSTGTGKWGTQSGSNYVPSSDKIVALDASANDQYGYSVGVYDNFGVVGSKSTDMSGNVDTGSAYIVINTGEGYWEESKQINPDDLDVQDEYGISVGIFGRSVVVGSWLSEGDQGGDPAHAGSAYIFNLPNPEGGTKALIYDTDYNRWKVGSVAPSDEAVVTKLGLLEDVDVTTIANDNVLAYNDASGNWKPASMGSLITIGDISDVDLSGVATGKAIIWDASLNKWIIGDGGGGAASGVTSTNIQPTVDEDGEPLSAGRLYYDTSWNSFHGRTTDGWQELLLSNTNLLFGAPASLKKSPYLETLLTVYPDRYEFTWENPPQYSTGFSASNASDYVNGELYLPVINHIKFEYFKTSENQTWGSTSRGVVTIGGKSGVGRGSINGNATQTLTNAAGTQKITNKLILYSTGSGAQAGVSDGWTNLNTASGGTYEYDFIDTDASGNQVYHFNPRSGNFSVQAQTPYSFRIWAENSVTPNNYRYWNGVTTQLVPVPSAIKVADPGQYNGFFAEIIHSGAVHKIKVVIPKDALTAPGVEVSQGGTDLDDSVFFEAYEVQYQTVNAVTNENVETSAITGWTNWIGEEGVEAIFDEGTAFSATDHYAAIPADTPLQNKNNISANVYKHITINQFDNKFYRFRVRAKNQVSSDYGPWSTDYYVVRFTRPQKMAWNTNNPPLFLTKSSDPDKWFITLTWQDRRSSDGGVTTSDDDWTHWNLSIAEFRLTRSTDNGSSYSVVDHEAGNIASLSAKTTYDYCVASASDTTQKWSDPQYKFKIQARNYLFGTSSNDANAWSTISEASVTLTPTTPATPTHLQLKFYEQSQKNTTSNPASYYSSDPWTAPSNDYVLYQWDINFDNTGSGYGTTDYNGVTVGTANKLTPEQYQLEYLVGKANISGSTLRLVTTVEGTTNVDQYRNTELLANDYYRLGTGTTIYQVSSVSNDTKKHILNHTGSETGIQDIYKVVYINATDKNLPGANPYYPRVYNVEQYVGGGYGLSSLLRNASWSFTVKAKNYFVSTASSGFSSAGPYGLDPPANVRFIAGTTIDITNSKIILSFNEPDTSSKSAYANNPGIFHTSDAIDYKSFAVEPFINSVSQGNRSIYTTAQSATRREVAYDHMIGSNNTLFDLAEGAGSTIKYKFHAENVLDTVYGDSVESTFKILRPAPTSMDSIPLFEWQTDGTNNIKLTLRRSNGGLAPNTSNSNTGSTICPVESLSSTGGDTATLKATVDELYWEVKASTALSNGITASFTDYAGTSWTNQDYVVANIGTLALNTEYEIFFRLRNRYVSNWKESTSPKVMLKVPNAPTNLTCVLDIVDDNAGHDNRMTFTWTRPSEPGLHFQHDGATDEAALIADPDFPYIKEYQISIDDSSTGGYAIFVVTGGSASERAPETFTLTGSISAWNGSSTITFNVNPDTTYSNIKISAKNVRAPNNWGAWSTAVTPTYVTTGRTRVTANIGVPYTIADVDETYSGSRPTWNLGGNYTYGNQVTLTDGTAVSGTVKNWNTISTTSTNIGNVLVNRYNNKPGSGGIVASYFMRIEPKLSTASSVDSYNNSGQIKENSPSVDATGLTTVDGCGTLYLNKVEDLFPNGYNNTGQWFKTDSFYWALNRTPLMDHSGEAKTIKFGFYYYDGASTANPPGVLYNTVCTNQHFDEVNAASTISSESVNYSTVYKITGIPSLRPMGSSTSITVSYVVDQKSAYYVNSDYIGRVDIATSAGATSYLSGFTNKKTRTHFTNSGSSWTSNNNSHNIGQGMIATGKAQSKDLHVIVQHKNIYGDGTAWESPLKFIYDSAGYGWLDTFTARGLSYIHILFPNQSASHQGDSASFNGYRELTALNPPSAKFNPQNELDNPHISITGGAYTTSSDWNYGIFDGTDDVTATTCNGLAYYYGKFQSPTYLKSALAYGLGTSGGAYYGGLSTFYTWYSVGVSSTDTFANANNYRDNYRWAFFKFKYKNGTHSGTTPVKSQIYLANGNNDNNTNINFSDLCGTDSNSGGVSPAVKICTKSLFNDNGTLKCSGWNQLVNNPTTTTTSPGNLSASQLKSSAIMPPGGGGSASNLPWTTSTGKRKTCRYTGGSIPSNSTWKSNNRPLPFDHGPALVQTSDSLWHIIAVGIRNDASKYIGTIYIDDIYDNGTTI